MNLVESSTSWRLLSKIQTLDGYGYGSRYPSLVLSFEGLPLSKDDKDSLRQIIKDCCPGIIESIHDDENQISDWHQSVAWLLEVWRSLQVASGLPVYEAGRAIAHSATQVRCVVPTLSASLNSLAKVINETVRYLSEVHAEEATATRADRLKLSIKALFQHSPKGSNVPRFLKAAYELGIPFQELPGDAYQYGYAKRARWLDSSFTDVTSTISAKLCRNKMSTSSLLRQAGLPAPSHYLAPDPEHAVNIADHLGYPVVVKPADLDGGVGVAPGLRSGDDVRRAFANAIKYSKNILVEKHFEGRDYRLTVFNGEMIWAIERIPAGVTGDGKNSISQLIELINADPRRGIGRHAPLKRIQIDEESNHLLEIQELQITSVPKDGQFVRLRRAANVASGGMPLAVFDEVHPDNARLAVRAAKIMRLDLAGIDLLIPNIGVSWRTSGAAICEVNGQPNLGQTTAMHLYPSILKQLITGSGRVPTILVVGATRSETWLEALSREFASAGIKAGLVGSNICWLGKEIIHEGDATPYAGGKMMALNRDVGGVVIAVEDFSILRTGLPVSRVDAVILAGKNLRSSETPQTQNTDRWITELLRCLLPACDGVVVTLPEQMPKMAHLKRFTKAAWHETSGEVDAVCQHAFALINQIVLSRDH